MMKDEEKHDSMSILKGEEWQVWGSKTPICSDRRLQESDTSYSRGL